MEASGKGPNNVLKCAWMKAREAIRLQSAVLHTHSSREGEQKKNQLHTVMPDGAII